MKTGTRPFACCCANTLAMLLISVRPIVESDFDNAIKQVRASVNPSDLKAYMVTRTPHDKQTRN